MKDGVENGSLMSVLANCVGKQKQGWTYCGNDVGVYGIGYGVTKMDVY